MKDVPKTIEAVWKIESTRLIAAIARVTHDVRGDLLMKMGNFPEAREEIQRHCPDAKPAGTGIADGEAEADGESRPVNLGAVQSCETLFSPVVRLMTRSGLRARVVESLFRGITSG
jgi:hypothetical protein